MGFLSFPTMFGPATVSGGILPGSGPQPTPYVFQGGPRPANADYPPTSVRNPLVEPPAQHHPTPKPGEPTSLLPQVQNKLTEAPPIITEKLRNPMFEVSDLRHPGLTPDITHVNIDLLNRFSAVQQQTGKQMPIVSGYRGETYNAQVGGAKHSQHLEGNAIDVDVRGMSIEDRQRVIKSARANGIQGIGIYSNSLHFDIGRKRAWGPTHHFDSIPDWARIALQ